MTIVTESLAQTRVLATAIPGPRSREMHAERLASVADPIASAFPVYLDRAEGAILRDVDGNQVIDLASGVAVTSIGANHPAVVAAVTEQVADFTHTCYGVTPYEEYYRVAQRLNELTPGDHDKRTALFSSGAEAVENAIKIARRATGRSAVIAFDNSFHGRTNLTMALSAKQYPYKQGFGPLAGDVHRARMADPYRWSTGPENCADEAFAEFVALVNAQIGAGNVAAVIVEPVQGEGGFIVPAAGFLPRVQAWCRENGVVFIADEIQAGVGRTGRWFASEWEGLEPDLITIGKGIANGLPLSAVTGRAELMNAAQAGGIGGTYAGNPIACAAALATLEVIESEGLLARAEDIGALMRARLEAIQQQQPALGEVRGRGAMIAVEFVDPATREPDAALTGRIVAACHAAGVLVLTAGTWGNVLRFLPPLVISDELLNDAFDVITEAIAAATR
ncbi:4-aminobutyrate--2-oxoglutarate transaminase [Microbacterium gorillae]|uniref:4-aminobutyrate--2-oxoglutarate transaminase n=1 Tax=Microbacterium gorillae TaxID=1231063 RepID=UPI00058F4CF8|nr:4-aminobutyrate--2-oxoglutarate transaminase [Microbacterium gorillae]